MVMIHLAIPKCKACTAGDDSIPRDQALVPTKERGYRRDEHKIKIAVYCCLYPFSGHLATDALRAVRRVVSHRVVPSRTRRRVLLSLRLGSPREPHQPGRILRFHVVFEWCFHHPKRPGRAEYIAGSDRNLVLFLWVKRHY